MNVGETVVATVGITSTAEQSLSWWRVGKECRRKHLMVNTLCDKRSESHQENHRRRMVDTVNFKIFQ